MILQNEYMDKAEAVVQALAAAEAARQKLAQTQEQLADADAALEELGVEADGEKT